MDEQDKQFARMTGTKIPGLIIAMAIPSVISMLVTSLYNIVDTFFIALLRDDSITGALNVVFSLMAIIQAFGFTVGMGSGSIISRLLGKKEYKKANETATAATLMAILCGVLITVFGLLFLEPLMTLLGGKGDTLEPAMIYGRYILLGAPLMTCSFTFNNFLRAQGKANFAMIGLCTGAILNMALDPVLIFACGMGVEGAALSTLVSQTISFFVLLLLIFSKKSLVHPKPKDLPRGAAIYGNILKTGFPSFVRQGLSSIATALLNNAAYLYGQESAITAVGVVQKVFMVVFCFALGIGQGYQPVLGYNYGAKRYDRVRKGFLFTLCLGTAILTVMAVLCAVFARPIAALFVENGQGVEIAVRTLRYQSYCMPFLMFNFIMGLTYQAIGNKWLATLLSSSRQGLFYIPAVLILPGILGLTGVECVQAVSDLCAFLFAVPFLILFLRRVRKMQTEQEQALPETEAEAARDGAFKTG